MTWQLRALSPLLLLLCSGLPACGQKAAVSPFPSPELNAKEALSQAPVIVIGFPGGFVRHDDMVHSPVQLAARIRSDYPSGVYARVFENRHGEEAHEEILKTLDTGHNGTLSDEEKCSARIIIYGISWGGSETVELARELEKDKIPVLLTIQVDSIQKLGQNDRLIPANVAEAVNFYQSDGLLHGEPRIQAMDPSHTKILGNYRYEYSQKPLQCEDYPWYDRLFIKQHTEIECDPAVWSQVESLIRSKLPTVQEGASAQSQKQ